MNRINILIIITFVFVNSYAWAGEYQVMAEKESTYQDQFQAGFSDNTNFDKTTPGTKINMAPEVEKKGAPCLTKSKAVYHGLPPKQLSGNVYRYEEKNIETKYQCRHDKLAANCDVPKSTQQPGTQGHKKIQSPLFPLKR